MPSCNRMFCCIFGWYFYVEIRLKCEKIFCCPALELFHCLPPLVHLKLKKLREKKRSTTYHSVLFRDFGFNFFIIIFSNNSSCAICADLFGDRGHTGFFGGGRRPITVRVVTIGLWSAVIAILNCCHFCDFDFLCCRGFFRGFGFSGDGGGRRFCDLKLIFKNSNNNLLFSCKN